MNRTNVGDLQESVPLVVGEITNKGDLCFDSVEHPLLGFARVVRRSRAATKAALSGRAVTSAESCLAGLHRRARDRLLLPRTVRLMEPRSPPARHTHTPARCTRFHSGGEWPIGPQLQNRVCLAPRPCSQHDREAPEKLNASRQKQAPSVLDSIERPGRGSVYEMNHPIYSTFTADGSVRTGATTKSQDRINPIERRRWTDHPS
jgi:hypothetical protein